MQLSHSQIQTFRQCALRYKLQYLHQLPRRPRRYARLGRLVHAAIRRAYQYAEDGRFSREDLLAHYDEVCDVVREPQVAQTSEYRQGRAIMENFYRTIEGLRARPTMLEQRFRVEIGDHVLTGAWDRVDLLEETGGYEVLDYKLSKVVASQEEVDEDLQLSLYCLAFESLQGVLPERVSLVYLRTGEKRSTQRTRRQLVDVAGEVRAAAREVQRETQFNPRAGDWCRWCDYVEYCSLKVALPRPVGRAARQTEMQF